MFKIVNLLRKDMNALQIEGRIFKVLPALSGTSQRTGNSWMSQDYVLQFHVWDGARNPNHFVFRVFGEDRIKQYNIQQGEDLTVQFDIDAHEFNGRWFNDVRAYNVVRGQVPTAAGAPVGAPQASPFPPADGATSPFPPAQEPAGEGSTDDLPF